MAKTQDIKRRIRSVSNTMQLTRAMKMVAAAKLRRAQERMTNSRPYAHRTLAVLRSLAQRAEAESHPLLRFRAGRRMQLVVLTGDRGLCGSFNNGVLREGTNFVERHPDSDIDWVSVGKKGRDFLRHRNQPVVNEYTDVFRQVEFAKVSEIAEVLMQRFIKDEVDWVYLVYNEFKSAIQARPVVQRLLPIRESEVGSADTVEDYIYEPGPKKLFDALLPHYVKNQVFQAMLESAAAEHAARMAAMESATKNAGELIEQLTLTMNRIRQASITTEIIEVVSGAEALG